MIQCCKRNSKFALCSETNKQMKISNEGTISLINSISSRNRKEKNVVGENIVGRMIVFFLNWENKREREKSVQCENIISSKKMLSSKPNDVFIYTDK